MGLLLLAVPAFAAPRVAVHPLVVLGGDARAVDQSSTDYIGEAAQQPIQMVSRSQVAEVLAAQPGGGCTAQSEGCLEILCRETGATYALLTTLMLDGPNFVLGARVVAANGKFVKAIEALTIEKDLFSPRGPQVQAAYKKLFAQLDLGALPEQVASGDPKPDPVLTPEPEPVVVAPAPVELREPHEGGGGSMPLRIGGLIVGGAALITGGIATGFALKASSDADLLRESKRIHGGLILDTEIDRAQAVDSNTTLATGLCVGAGVAAAASIVMLLLSGDSQSQVAITPVAGGATVGLSGSF